MMAVDTALGLDIGHDSIKLVQLKQQGEKIELSKIDSAKISGLLEGQTQAEQRKTIKRVILNLFAKNKIKTKKLTLGINGQSVFIKFLDLLPVTNEKLEQTIKYEAQQQIPFSLEEVEWDAHVFSETDQEYSSTQRVLLVAIKKDKSASRKSLLEEIKLQPTILDISSLAMYNCLKFNTELEQERLTLVVDIGARSTDLLIIRGEDIWMRSFAIGGNSLTEAIKKKSNIGFREAESLKENSGLDNLEVKEAINPVLEDLQAEISRSIEYYFFQQKQASLQQPSLGRSDAESSGQIDEILLSGGSSRLSGLDQFLAENFSCPVKPLDPFNRLELDQGIKDKLEPQDEVLFSQAVGLALRGLGQSTIDINLLKEQNKLKSESKQKVAFGVSSIVLALLIIFSASTFLRHSYREKSARLQRLKGLLKTFSTYQPEIKQLQKQESILAKENMILGNLAQNRALWLEVLRELQQMLPDDLWVTEFVGTISFDNFEEDFASKLDLQGKASSYEGVNSFVAKLKSSTLFTEVKPLSSAFVEEQAQNEKEQKVEVVKFSISMKVLPVGYSK